jgi:hypothetical protein
MQIIEYLKELASRREVLAPLERYVGLKPAADYPYQDYIGVNFNKEKISGLKFYFSFYQALTSEISSVFLDEQLEFEKYKHLWQPQKYRDLNNTGFSFTLKTDENFNVTKGFHFRFPYNKEIFPATKSFRLDPSDLLNAGINFEYKNGQNLAKYYYYFHKVYNKHRFAVRFDESFLCGADLIEYTESEKFNKIIAWNFSEDPVFEHFSLRQEDIPVLKNINDLLSANYGYYHRAWKGMYEGKEILSRYYFNYHDDEKRGNFPGDKKENFQVYTVKDFLQKIKSL